MKVKKILIAYLNNGNMESIVSKEILFNKLIGELIEEGRKVKGTLLSSAHKYAKFEDGSKIQVMPFSQSLKGHKVTHLYVDEELLNMPKGIELFETCLAPTIIHFPTETFDTDTPTGERVFTFKRENEKMKINKYNS